MARRRAPIRCRRGGAMSAPLELLALWTFFAVCALHRAGDGRARCALLAALQRAPARLRRRAEHASKEDRNADDGRHRVRAGAAGGAARRRARRCSAQIVLARCCSVRAVGVVDDYLAIRRGSNRGLRARTKFLATALIAAIFLRATDAIVRALSARRALPRRARSRSSRRIGSGCCSASSRLPARFTP